MTQEEFDAAMRERSLGTHGSARLARGLFGARKSLDQPFWR